jgi:hypothetical protein
MRRKIWGWLICRHFGHRYFNQVDYAPNFYCCARCGDPGFWISAAKS